MKLADLQAAVAKWTKENAATQKSLKAIRDGFVQMGQDYLDIFRDHKAPPTQEVDQLINH